MRRLADSGNSRGSSARFTGLHFPTRRGAIGPCLAETRRSAGTSARGGNRRIGKIVSINICTEFMIHLKKNHVVHDYSSAPPASRLLPRVRMSTDRLPFPKASVRASVAAIRIGYVPLSDAAPLLVADALGLFRQHGLDVRLERELGWGSIRDKLAYGELDATHAPGGLLYSILCGTHARPRDVRADVVLNLQGNAITLSKRLWQKGVRDAATLRLLFRSESPRKLSFAVVSPFSTHLFLLRKWLSKAGIDPERDARIAVLPPPLVAEHMRAGLIDGFCVGEPWNSAAALAGDGWIIATSATLEPRHPEKILIASDALAIQRPEEYAALQEAVVTACRYCDTPEGRTTVVDLLHSHKLFPVSREVIANGLIGPLNKGDNLAPDTARLIHFYQHDANRATRDRAAWFLESLCSPATLTLDAAQRRACLEVFHDRMFEVGPAKTTRKPNRKKTK